ncbi:MAG TPA: VOC family protein [Mycobacteriales bacterium]|jgi:glyoxylase I family protein|nr:VOC family protein [Mycobacteriales bacterium]
MADTSFTGLHHVAINVRDLEKSVQWYGEVLGFAPLFPYDTDAFQRRIMRHPSGVVIGLTRHNSDDGDAEFNERRTGLDHIAFGVGSREELEAWLSRLDAAGVTHSGISETPTTGSVLIAFRDPDNIQLELYVAQGATASS